MAFDGITTYHIAKELEILKGGRIRKIHQPEGDELRLIVNVGRDNYHLLISANGNHPRLHLTTTKKENPAAPPSFCMMLRKQILNGTILDIRTHLSDRLVLLDIGTKNEFNEPVTKTLVVEIMARNSNVILLGPGEAPGEEVILDAMKKVGSSLNRYRQILPGRIYVYPPEGERKNFFAVDKDELASMFEAHKPLSLEHFFVQAFLGFSPGAAREIAFRAGLSAELMIGDLTVKQQGYLRDAFFELIADIKAGPRPRLYYFGREVLDFTTVDYRHLDATEVQDLPTVSELLESFYFQRDKKQRFKTKSANLRQQLTTLLKKSQKKLANLQADMDRSYKNENYKRYGDLITANIYQLEKGMKSAELIDYTDEAMATVTIPLKVNESPSQNAQRYYKRYNKAKRAQIELARQLETTAEQVYYLESLVNALEHSTELGELDEIRHEYRHSEFYKKAPGRGEEKIKLGQSKPLHYVSSEGFDIYVGKNNYQNDFIVTRLGEDEDCWLHVKDIPGSHVLVVAAGRFIEEATLIEAGMLAAYYSQAKHSENVPVDYVEFKYVKKPRKALPGKVIFTNQNTMFVTPDKEKIAGLVQVTED